MDLTIYQVDAFADDVFKGNPAAIVPLKDWLSDTALQAIAMENNLAETAYFVPHESGAEGHFHLRWFTPGAEVDLCGHATLASAYVLFKYLDEASDTLVFETRSGALAVKQEEGGFLSMDFPALSLDPATENDLIDVFSKAIGQSVHEAFTSQEYVMCVLKSEADVRAVQYSGAIEDALRASPFWGLIITAPADAGQDYDFVSRFFAPEKGVPEDSVTGSAHCRLAPFWAERLGKNDVVGYQASPRGGEVRCALDGERVTLSGRVAPYLVGTISI